MSYKHSDIHESTHAHNVQTSIKGSVGIYIHTYICESFKHAVPLYEEALDKGCYNYQLNFEATLPNPTKQIRTRKRFFYLVQPNRKNVATNIGRTFLKILDKEFPADHVLHKIFKRNTVTISYSGMSNIKQNIDGQNKSKLSNDHQLKKSKKCNCRKPNECPLSGNCQASSIIYQATVKANDNSHPQTYVGLTENKFKAGFPLAIFLRESIFFFCFVQIVPVGFS